MKITHLVALFLSIIGTIMAQDNRQFQTQRVCLFDEINKRSNPSSFAGLEVEGDGKLLDFVKISTLSGKSRLLLRDRDPVAFSTITNSSNKNACLEGFAIGVPISSQPDLKFRYIFEFKYPVNWFQLKPLDFGDNNAPLANSTSMWLAAFSRNEFGGQSVIIHRHQDGNRMRKKFDACDKFNQTAIFPLLIRAAPGKTFDRIEARFSYTKNGITFEDQSSDDQFGLTDICFEVILPVCSPPKNAGCSCLSSKFWNTRASLTVTNSFSETINVYWVTAAGVETRTTSIHRGTTYVLNTYLSHVFRFRDNCGELLYEQPIRQTQESIVVTGVYTAAPCTVDYCATGDPSNERNKTRDTSIVGGLPTLTGTNGTSSSSSSSGTKSGVTPTPEKIEPMEPVAPIDCIPRGAPKPEIVESIVVLRDLRKNHPDMEQEFAAEQNLVETIIGEDGKPVYNKTTRSTTTTGAKNFVAWFNAAPGINKEHNWKLTLQMVPETNYYVYDSSSFFPLDKRLWGNEGMDHNYYWTLEMRALFTYKGGEFFTFTGNDDVWVFVNGELVIDMGGIHGSTKQTFSLDDLAGKLSLTKEYTYPFALFYANRKKSSSDFHIQTSIVLKRDCAYIKQDSPSNSTKF